MEKLSWGRGVGGVWGRLDIFTLSPNELLSMASLLNLSVSSPRSSDTLLFLKDTEVTPKTTEDDFWIAWATAPLTSSGTRASVSCGAIVTPGYHRPHLDQEGNWMGRQGSSFYPLALKPQLGVRAL